MFEKIFLLFWGEVTVFAIMCLIVFFSKLLLIITQQSLQVIVGSVKKIVLSRCQSGAGDILEEKDDEYM